MDLSKKLKSLEELENEFNDQLDLQNLYDFSELDDQEVSELTPLLSSLKMDQCRYGEALDSKCGGEKQIQRIFDTFTGREVAFATPLKNKSNRTKNRII